MGQWAIGSSQTLIILWLTFLLQLKGISNSTTTYFTRNIIQLHRNKQFKKLIKGISAGDTLSHKIELSILKGRGLEILGSFHELEQEDLYKEEQEFERRLNDLLLATKAATNKKFQAFIEERIKDIQVPK